jgi:hypothetical protein
MAQSVGDASSHYDGVCGGGDERECEGEKKSVRARRENGRLAASNREGHRVLHFPFGSVAEAAREHFSQEIGEML